MRKAILAAVLILAAGTTACKGNKQPAASPTQTANTGVIDNDEPDKISETDGNSEADRISETDGISETDENADSSSAAKQAPAADGKGSQKYLCTPEDSIEIESLLRQAKEQQPENKMLFFARKLLGRPYVAHTLETPGGEQLVVNMKQLDCTTYTETCTALTLCAAKGKTTLGDYLKTLRTLRYYDGEIHGYPSRLHYFTEWIEENTKNGLVKEVQAPEPPFTATQTIDAHFMSANPQYYRQLEANPALIKDIKKNENKINGKKYKYIPKSLLGNNQLMKKAVKDGDIIAILTSKDGLDTSHIGIAVWHSDGLHLLNASSLKSRKKTVEETMTFKQYMDSQKTNIGIRVIRVIDN